MSERSELFFPRENNLTSQAANDQLPVLKNPGPNLKQAPNNWPQSGNRKNTGDAAT
jgi:hypothetical protein